MQRSRRALLQTRVASHKAVVLGRNQFCKVALWIILLTWGTLFFLCSLVAHADVCKDGSTCDGNESTLNEVHENPYEKSDTKSVPNALEGAFASDGVTSTKSLFDATEENKISNTTDSKLSSSSAWNEEVEEKILILSSKEDKGNAIDVPIKSEKTTRVAPPGLDEFKSKAITTKERSISNHKGRVAHRVEPGGKEYNYASSSKGAKILDFNKEAKGASNILEKDKDKYLRNPCSVEKYVVIELSEETLVDTIEIANFEHYSSNLKDFEVSSSLVYPSDSWPKLGNFSAGNIKHTQRFSLPEPKWARYLKLNFLSHYGSEFYCTISVLEVYGVDAVERMLEDLISVQSSNRAEDEGQTIDQKLAHEPSSDDVSSNEEHVRGTNFEVPIDYPKGKPEMPTVGVSDPVLEARPSQVGRMPGDTVLKILMQKVQSLDVNFAVLERYMEELNNRYGDIIKELDDDITVKEKQLEKIRSEIMNLEDSKNILAKNIGDIVSWKSNISSQLDQLVNNNAMLRREIERGARNQVDMENKSLAVIFFTFVFGFLSLTMLVVGMFIRVCRLHRSAEFCRTSIGWLFLLLTCSIITFILVL